MAWTLLELQLFNRNVTHRFALRRSDKIYRVGEKYLGTENRGMIRRSDPIYMRLLAMIYSWNLSLCKWSVHIIPSVQYDLYKTVRTDWFSTFRTYSYVNDILVLRRSDPINIRLLALIDLIQLVVREESWMKHDDDSISASRESYDL